MKKKSSNKAAPQKMKEDSASSDKKNTKSGSKMQDKKMTYGKPCC